MRNVRSRHGERRAHPRFEILGTLAASIEMWKRHDVRNVSQFGALIETTEEMSVASRLSGDMFLGPSGHHVNAEVRHTTPLPSVDGLARYGVGVEFLEAAPSMVRDLENRGHQPIPVMDISSDRRLSPRYECSGLGHIQFRSWVTATLHDISVGGAMFASTSRFESGGRGHLRTFLDDRPFAAEIVVMRVGLPHDDSGYRVGASFASVDDESRRTLRSALTGASDR